MKNGQLLFCDRLSLLNASLDGVDTLWYGVFVIQSVFCVCSLLNSSNVKDYKHLEHLFECCSGLELRHKSSLHWGMSED